VAADGPAEEAALPVRGLAADRVAKAGERVGLVRPVDEREVDDRLAPGVGGGQRRRVARVTPRRSPSSVTNTSVKR
jgi:hypothetical protein